MCISFNINLSSFPVYFKINPLLSYIGCGLGPFIISYDIKD